MNKTKSNKLKECGSCSVCCVALTIDEPELQKLADVPCVNIRPQGGCSIYEKRPDVCKGWTCGWLNLDRLSDSLRPDKSNLLIKIEESSITLQPIGNPERHLTTTEVLEFIANCIHGSFEIAISLPTKPGLPYIRNILNQTISITDTASENQIRGKVIAAIMATTSAKAAIINVVRAN